MEIKYCVIKNTTKVIDGSNNPLEIMLQNAENAGFTESEVEILTEEEYQSRKDAEPKPKQPPTKEELMQAEIDQLKAKLADIEQTDTVKAELIALKEPIVKEPILKG